MTGSVLAFLALSVFAEIAPEHYVEMRRRAPEVLLVEVTSVDVNRDYKKYCFPFDFEIERRVTLDARVTSVVRSATGVKGGETIRIEYTSTDHCDGWAGPGPIPVLKKGQRAVAYLKKGERAFGPAAMGWSFSGETRVELR